MNDTRTLLDLVEIGLGVAVFPEALAAPRGAQLREIAISGRRWDWTVRAETLAPGPSNPAVTRHAEWARMERSASGGVGMTGGACGVVVPGVRVGTTEWERPARLKFAA